ncbi:hypothetical protein O0L34_g4883 [Tuta absoluta]|nr:hypothetical protein O0L34_g4883 [Tuta absoluta]
MWYLWTAILVASCALVTAEGGVPARAEAPAPATTRAPNTLDRLAAEQAWRVWLQSPESGNPQAPPRRITTKSLFITPLVCPKGQRLDSNACVQALTVNKDEHERILLEQLNALFTSAPSGDVVYDYGDDEPGPLQLSIPIALDPLAERLQAEPSAQAQEHQPTYAKPDKKDDARPDAGAGLVAELELLQLQHSQNKPNDTSYEATDILNHNVLQSIDKPKRDSPITNTTKVETNSSDEGQKEVVYGHVNIDPILYDTKTETEPTTTEADTEPTTTTTESQNDEMTTTVTNSNTYLNNTPTETAVDTTKNDTKSDDANALKKDGDRTKLNPETDYADIGEAIKLISRYAEVTTDDNFSKAQKKIAVKDDSILGTRTKLQYRRKPKPADVSHEPGPPYVPSEHAKDKTPAFPKKDVYYRYPWPSQHSPTPPPDYPFRHIQDYWPGRNQVGGVYNTAHENPRRHHHMFPHNYYRSHNMPYANYPGPYPGQVEGYPGQSQPYPHRIGPHHVRPMRSHGTNQDLYTLLGLRHWFSSEDTSKR